MASVQEINVNARVLRICTHVVPGGLVLAFSCWIITHRLQAPPSASELVKVTPVAVFGVGLILSAAFHRSRLFHALLLLGVCTLVLTEGHRHLSAPAIALITKEIGVLFPLNLVMISFLPETGVFTRRGLIRLGALVFQIAALAVSCRFYLGVLDHWIDHRLFLMLPFNNVRSLPHTVLASSAISFLLLLLALVHRRFRPTDIGLLWALAASCVALAVAHSPQLSSLAFSAGAMVLVIALLETFYAMAYIDELTELPSRRSFNDAKMKLGSTYTVAMVDVDHFKNFNDTYGHDAGDHVLRMVASRLGNITGGGKVYRYGGEEFAVLFPGKQVDETFPHLERLRRSIEEIPFKLRGKDRRRAGKNRRSKQKSQRQSNITVSIGAAGIVGVKRSPDELVKAADKALYRAKACGRNCTIVGESEFQTA